MFGHSAEVQCGEYGGNPEREASNSDSSGIPGEATYFTGFWVVPASSLRPEISGERIGELRALLPNSAP